VQLGHLDVACDAPPYAVVEGCQLIGLSRPEDVRWCRVDHIGTEQGHWGRRFLDRIGKPFKNHGPVREMTCRCGESFVALMKYMFLFDTGHKECYRIGQCDRCGSIYWDNA
jgi:hypothetical protein